MLTFCPSSAELHPVIEAIARRNPALAVQLSRALDSVLQNVAEGSGSQGCNRRARYFNALGSQTETRACLDIAVARKFIAPMSPALHKKLDGISAVLWTVTH
jgi:four helix bundle protein